MAIQIRPVSIISFAWVLDLLDSYFHSHAVGMFNRSNIYLHITPKMFFVSILEAQEVSLVLSLDSCFECVFLQDAKVHFTVFVSCNFIIFEFYFAYIYFKKYLIKSTGKQM